MLRAAVRVSMIVFDNKFGAIGIFSYLFYC